MRLLRFLLLLTCLGLSIYGLYCALHMRAYIGTGYYWSNPWFYKGHACLFAIIVLRIITPTGQEAKS